MSRWDDQFENHGVFGVLAIVRESLEATSGHLGEADQRESHARIGHVVDFIERALNAADPELVPPVVLDNLNSNLGTINGHLQAFAVDQQPASLDAANATADGMLSHASRRRRRASVAYLSRPTW
jgi:hypothetical protein